MVQICMALPQRGGRGFDLAGSADTHVTAQSSALNANSHKYIRNWQPADGLPQITVAALAQTNDGYLWLGTQAGLVRFDGVRFVLIDEQQTPDLDGVNIWRLLTDRRGSLWIGTMNGRLVRLRDGAWQRITVPAFPITALWEAGDGVIWVATMGGGAGRIENDVFVAMPGAVADERVLTLTHDGDGGLLALGRFNLAKRVGEQWVALPLTGLAPTTALNSLAIDVKGDWWLGTDVGLYRRQGSTWSPIPFGIASPGRGPARVQATAPGLLVSDNQGIWRAEASGQVEKLLPMNARVLSMFEDRERNFWIGTQVHGLYRITANSVRMLGQADGLSSEFTTTVMQSSSGTSWIGTQNGLNQWRENGVLQYAVDTPFNTIRSLQEDLDGRLWIGTTRGLHGLHDDQLARHPGTVGEPTVSIVTSLRDPLGRLWVATRDGLYRIDQDVTERFTVADGLADNWIRALELGQPDELWVATAHGLARFSITDEHFTAVPMVPLAPDEVILSLEFDRRDGSLWIALQNRGLGRLRAGQFVLITGADGLPSDGVYATIQRGRRQPLDCH